MLSIHKLLFPLAIKNDEGFDSNGNQTGGQISGWGSLLQLILALCAGYLSWQCNADEQMIIRIIYAVLSGIFSVIYLLYYVIWHVVKKEKCGVAGSSISAPPTMRLPPPPSGYPIPISA